MPNTSPEPAKAARPDQGRGSAAGGLPDLNGHTTRVIGQRTGLSIALVVVIVSGIVASVLQTAALREYVSNYGIQLANASDDITEIKLAVRSMTTDIRRELSDLHRENATLRERLAAIEARLGKGN